MRLSLSPSEISAIEDLARPVTARGESLTDSARLRDVALRAHSLPPRLREFLDEMKRAESAAFCVISGMPVDDTAIGRTPSTWTFNNSPSPTAREEAILMMCGSLLGDAFGWATQQNGAIIHDILPVRGQEHEQLSTGSKSLLQWHTEEAFHPLRCDYLGLTCLRNPDQVATLIASVSGIELTDEDRDTLFEPLFYIKPDTSHLLGAYQHLSSSKEQRLLAAAQERAIAMNREPEPSAVLFGDRDSPYLCIDPAYMYTMPGQTHAEAALKALMSEIDSNLQHVVLHAGDICFIDNFRAVHGRSAFTPRYNGTDRWLKRVNFTRDLRRSRTYRADSDSRVVY